MQGSTLKRTTGIEAFVAEWMEDVADGFAQDGIADPLREAIRTVCVDLANGSWPCHLSRDSQMDAFLVEHQREIESICNWLVAELGCYEALFADRDAQPDISFSRLALHAIQVCANRIAAREGITI